MEGTYNRCFQSNVWGEGMRILISPHSRPLRWGDGKNPKDYPWWAHLFNLLDVRGHEVIQIGRSGENKVCHKLNTILYDMTLDEVKRMVEQVDLWISVDNFLPHLVNYHKIKTPGIVIFGQSDPNIFGYKQFTNFLKDRSYLREKQFWLWEQATYNEDAFVEPEEIAHFIRNKFETTANTATITD